MTLPPAFFSDEFQRLADEALISLWKSHLTEMTFPCPICGADVRCTLEPFSQRYDAICTQTCGGWSRN